MPRRCVGQLNFMDAAVSRRPRGRLSALDEIARWVDGAAFERLLSAMPIAKKGEPSSPPLVMFIVLLPQRWYAVDAGSGLVMRRRFGRELAPAEVANHQLSLIRRGVESLFGTMKRGYRLARCRAFPPLRNTADLAFFCLAFNLRRWRRLTAR